MTANEGQLRLNRPVAVAGVQVGVADTRAIELNETLAGLELLGLLDGVVVDDLEGGVRLLDDRRLLSLGDSELGGHCRRSGVEPESCEFDGRSRAKHKGFI